MSVNSTLKAIYIIVQRKALYMQRILEFTCARKETVEIEMLVTSKNGDKKSMQSIRIMSRPPTRIRKWVEPVEPVQMNSYQSNTKIDIFKLNQTLCKNSGTSEWTDRDGQLVLLETSQPAFTCSKLTTKTPE